MTPLYAGIGGVVRELTEMDAGINGVVTPLTEMWAGVDGVNRQIFSSIKTLNDFTWSEISDISENNQGENYWSVGDCKELTINGTIGDFTISNYTTFAYIIGFNHNSSIEGIGITFGLFKTASSDGISICLVDTNYGSSQTSGAKGFSMNHWWNTSYYGSNFGGWSGCDLRYDILGSTDKPPSQYGYVKTSDNVGYDATSTTATRPVPKTLMSTLPSDLRSVIKPINIYTDNKGCGNESSAYVTKTIDYLPLMSEFEIFGSSSQANPSEKNYQEQYQYYKNGNSKMKYKHNNIDSAARFWDRSPCYFGSSTFCAVESSGSQENYVARLSYGISPIFRV